MEWTVRDMLVSVLRDIDKGVIEPDCAVLMFDDKSGKTSYRAARCMRKDILWLFQTISAHALGDSFNPE